MPKDLFNTINPVVALLPQAAVNAAKTGATVAMSGYQAVDFVVALATPGDTLSATVYYEFYIEESFDGGSTWADAPAQFVQSGSNNMTPAPAHTGAIAILASSPSGASTLHGGYLGIAPHVRMSVAKTGTMTNGTAMAIVAVQGHGKHNPPSLGLNP